jgi:hypothetical protein
MCSRWMVGGFLCLSCSIALIGCVYVHSVTPTSASREAKRTNESLDAEAKRFAVAPGRANIYVYQTADSGVADTYLIVLRNLDVIGCIDGGTYLLAATPPGPCKIGTYGNLGEVRSATLDARPDTNYFIMVVPNASGWEFKVVDESQGRLAVMNRARAEGVNYGQPQVHVPSEPERTFQFVLNTLPCPARILVERNGTQEEIGVTPYNFNIGLAGRYEYWPVQSQEDNWNEYVRIEYQLYPGEAPLATVRKVDSIEAPLILDLKCTLVADGFEPQTIERMMTFKGSCSVEDPTSWIPNQTEINVGLNRPVKPEYVVKLKIDSIPTGADIYTSGTEGYLGEKLGTTPAEFDVGVANKRSEETSLPDPSQWVIWPPTKEDGFVTWSGDTHLSVNVNFVLFKDGYARQDISGWMFHRPKVDTFTDTQKTITIPLKTHEQARQERLDRIEEARTQLAAALEKTKLDLRQAEISNQQQLIQQQELISKYLVQLNVAFDRVSASPPGTITVRQDPHYDREWQDSMAALRSILQPYSKASPSEKEEYGEGLVGLGSLIDLMNR